MPAYSKQVRIPGKSAQELFDKISHDIEGLMNGMKVGSIKLDRDPAKKQVQVKASMFSATLSCTDGTLTLDAQLSLLALPFRSRIDEHVEKWVAKSFPA